MIEGTKVRLRSFRKDDLPVLIGLRNDEELQRLLLADWKPNSESDVRAWLQRRAEQPHALFAIVADRITDACCGFIQLLNMQPPHCNGSLGIALHSSARGRGLGVEAIELAIQHAAQKHRLRKVVLHVKPDNRPAVALYQRLNFRSVGTLQAHYWNGSTFDDVCVMERQITATAGTITVSSQERAA